jgi:hypothetical protein
VNGRVEGRALAAGAMLIVATVVYYVATKTEEAREYVARVTAS